MVCRIYLTDDRFGHCGDVEGAAAPIGWWGTSLHRRGFDFWPPLNLSLRFSAGRKGSRGEPRCW